MGNPNEAIPAVFDTAVEGFLRTYGDRITPTIRNEVKARGIDFDKISAAYPLDVFENALRRAGELLYPEVPDSDRWRLIGREFVDGFVQTTMGKAALMMARVAGTRRSLERLARTFRTTNNYLGSETLNVSDGQLELRLWMFPQFLDNGWRGRQSLHLDYRLGVLEGMMAQLGHPKDAVTLLEKKYDDQSARYQLRWRA